MHALKLIHVHAFRVTSDNKSELNQGMHMRKLVKASVFKRSNFKLKLSYTLNSSLVSLVFRAAILCKDWTLTDLRRRSLLSTSLSGKGSPESSRIQDYKIPQVSKVAKDSPKYDTLFVISFCCIMQPEVEILRYLHHMW